MGHSSSSYALISSNIPRGALRSTGLTTFLMKSFFRASFVFFVFMELRFCGRFATRARPLEFQSVAALGALRGLGSSAHGLVANPTRTAYTGAFLLRWVCWLPLPASFAPARAPGGGAKGSR
jgi:hypothetical protein